MSVKPTAHLSHGWQMRRLGDCARLVNGRAYSQDELLDAGTPVIRIQNLNGGDRWFYSDLSLPDEKYCTAGDLLFAWSASFGPYIWSGPRSIFHYHIWRVVPNETLDQQFAFHLLEWITERVKAASRGVAMLHMTKAGMENWEIPLPPLPEQRRIAAVLDQVEALQTQRRYTLAQLDGLSESIFIEMFGDTETILKNWPVNALGTSLDFLTSGSRGWATYYTEAGDLFLRIQNVRRDELSLDEAAYVNAPDTAEARRTLVQPGDVLLSITADLGRTAVVPANLGPAFINQHLCILRTKAFVPRFLSAYLASPMGQRQVMGRNKHAVKAGLNFEDIRSFQVPLPPLPLQEAFATRIQAIEALKAKHRAALAELDALFASLQHRAFNGELTAQVPTKPNPRRFAEIGQLDASKGLEALVYAARRLPNKGHYWPLKVQYVADRRHLERNGRSLYGETHVAMPYGPVPQAAFNASRALAEGELLCEFPMDAVRAALRRDGEKLVALRDADSGVLGADERESLDWAIRLVADMSFDELKTQTHDSAWEKTPRNASMAWQDIIESLAPAARQRLLDQFE